MTVLSDVFNIPLDAFPWSGNISQSQNLALNTSGSSGGSRSGIDWNLPFMKSLMPQLNTSVSSLMDTANNLGTTIGDKYSALMRQGLGPSAFQGTLNQLSNRGMLQSNVASDTLARAGTNIMQDIANRGFDALLAGAQAKMQVPSILGSLANLGQTSTSGYGSTSQGISGGTSNQRSYSANPLAPYELFSNLLRY